MNSWPDLLYTAAGVTIIGLLVFCLDLIRQIREFDRQQRERDAYFASLPRYWADEEVE